MQCRRNFPSLAQMLDSTNARLLEKDFSWLLFAEADRAKEVQVNISISKKMDLLAHQVWKLARENAWMIGAR
jgi:hypothetical protein